MKDKQKVVIHSAFTQLCSVHFCYEKSFISKLRFFLNEGGGEVHLTLNNVQSSNTYLTFKRATFFKDPRPLGFEIQKIGISPNFHVLFL